MTECPHGLEISTCATCSPRPDELIGSRRRGAPTSDSLTGFFESLGAPLKNSRWSWGSVREDDGVLIMRVWEDQRREIDGTPVVLVYRYIEGYRSPGIQERLRHLDLVRNGATCFLVFCTAEDPNHEPRSIATFVASYLSRGGRLIEHEGQTWIEVGERVPTGDVARWSAR